MSKFTIFSLFLCLFLAAANARAENSPLLPGTENILTDCRKDMRESTMEMFGLKIKIRQKTEPSADGGCHFESVTDSDFGINTTACTFNAAQLALLADAYADKSGQTVTETFSLYVEEENGNKTDSADMSVSGTAAEVLWAKFINNPDVCKITFSEKDVVGELVDAVRSCADFEKKIDFMGMKMEIKVTKDMAGCSYRLAAEMPSFSLADGSKNIKTPAKSIDTACILNAEQQEKLADYIESGNTYKYETNDQNGNKASIRLPLPEEFFSNPQICRITTNGF